MDRHLRQWLVLLKADISVSGLVLALVPERANVLRAGLRHPPSSEPLPGRVVQGVVSFDFPAVSAAGGLVGVLDVEYSGDAPLISAIAWRTEADGPPNPFSFFVETEPLVERGLVQTRGEQDSAVARIPWEAALQAHGARIELIRPQESAGFAAAFHDEIRGAFEHRRVAMEKDERARRFFFALELGTLGPNVDEVWRSTVQSVSEYLAWRVQVRASVGSRYVPAWARSDFMTRRLRVVSCFVRTLMEAHLEESVLPGVIGWAFTRFATDCLASTHLDAGIHGLLQSHGAPDGELFFSFAELAFACIELEIDTRHWQQTLPALVRSAHVYAEHGGLASSTGRPVYAYRENRRFPLGRICGLEQYYEIPVRVDRTLILEDRFTSLLSQALSTTPPDPMPEKKRDIRHVASFHRQATLLVSAHQARDFFSSLELFDGPVLV